jgi:GMP synthase PP-ATPase subunit
LSKCGFKNFRAYNAKDLFLEKLKEVYLPEAKRKVIGDTFIEV